MNITAEEHFNTFELLLQDDFQLFLARSENTPGYILEKLVKNHLEYYRKSSNELLENILDNPNVLNRTVREMKQNALSVNIQFLLERFEQEALIQKEIARINNIRYKNGIGK